MVPACYRGLWPRDRSEVSSCFYLSRLRIEGLAASSCYLSPCRQHLWETALHFVPCSGLQAYAGHLACFLAMTSITEPQSSEVASCRVRGSGSSIPSMLQSCGGNPGSFLSFLLRAPLPVQSRNGSSISSLTIGEKCWNACGRTLKIWNGIAEMQATFKILMSNYQVGEEKQTFEAILFPFSIS